MNNFTRAAQILILVVYVILACLFVYAYRPPYILNILIVYLPPTLLNLYWLQNSRKEVLAFSLCALALFALPVELIARLGNSWEVLSIFPRLFGTAPIENLVYAFFNFVWVLAFYEHFTDDDKDINISQKAKYLIGLYLILSVVVYSLYLVNRDAISRDYWEIAVLILVLPMVALFIHNPHIIKKTILVTLFFAFVFFFHEMVSMSIGHWWWPGEYVFTTTLVGQTFPLDDAVIWYFLSTPALIAGYEYFWDDDG